MRLANYSSEIVLQTLLRNAITLERVSQMRANVRTIVALALADKDFVAGTYVSCIGPGGIQDLLPLSLLVESKRLLWNKEALAFAVVHDWDPFNYTISTDDSILVALFEDAGVPERCQLSLEKYLKEAESLPPLVPPAPPIPSTGDATHVDERIYEKAALRKPTELAALSKEPSKDSATWKDQDFELRLYPFDDQGLEYKMVVRCLGRRFPAGIFLDEPISKTRLTFDGDGYTSVEKSVAANFLKSDLVELYYPRG